MPQIDMSREAVTARLKLVSELRRLCLSLGTAKIKTQSPVKTSDIKKDARAPNDSDPKSK
jgi:hypothetical protein